MRKSLPYPSDIGGPRSTMQKFSFWGSARLTEQTPSFDKRIAGMPTWQNCEHSAPQSLTQSVELSAYVHFLQSIARIWRHVRKVSILSLHSAPCGGAAKVMPTTRCTSHTQLQLTTGRKCGSLVSVVTDVLGDPIMTDCSARSNTF